MLRIGRVNWKSSPNSLRSAQLWPQSIICVVSTVEYFISIQSTSQMALFHTQ